MCSRTDALYASLLEDLAPCLPFSVLYENGELGPDATLRQRAAAAMLRSCLKKTKHERSNKADMAAYSKWQQANSDCQSWHLALETSLDELLIGEFAKAMESFFWTTYCDPLIANHLQILAHSKLGPGSNVGCQVNNPIAKLFSGDVSTSSLRLVPFFEDFILYNPVWVEAEMSRRQHGFTYTLDSSRLSFVPKTVDITRTICTEPTLSMFFQQGIGHLIESRLKTVFNIDFATQPDENRAMAKIGSLDGSFSTIDLSSASDSISLAMCRRFIPKPVLFWLELCRSTHTTYKDEVHELHMLSSMGNAYTFPLQTAIFACAVSAVYRLVGIPLRRASGRRNFSVFGDDIITDTRATRWVIHLLSLLGFKTNVDKTFTTGGFRESCGHDYYLGVNIRGIYVKSLNSTQDIYVAINLLNQWSAVTQIYLPRTVAFLRSLVLEYYTPLHENLDAGIRAPRRWVLPKMLNGIYSYKRYIPRNKLGSIIGENVTVSKRHRGVLVRKNLHLSYAAQEIGFVAGYLTSDFSCRLSMPIRVDMLIYDKRKGWSLNWDHPSDDLLGSTSSLAYITAFENNFLEFSDVRDGKLGRTLPVKGVRAR